MVSSGEVWLALKKMEAVMVSRVAQQVVPSGPNTTMGADFFLPYRTLLLLLLATFSCPPPPSSPPGKFFLPHPPWSCCSIFLAPSAPRWHRDWSLLKYSNSNQEGGVDDAAHDSDDYTAHGSDDDAAHDANEEEDENIQAGAECGSFLTLFEIYATQDWLQKKVNSGSVKVHILSS